MANPSGPPPSPLNFAIANLGTVSVQVLPSGVYAKLIFHNPNVTSSGGVAVAIAAGFDHNGNPVLASYGASGGGPGSIVILPGDTYEIDAGSNRITTAWQAIAQSGSANSLTILAFLGQPGP